MRFLPLFVSLFCGVALAQDSEESEIRISRRSAIPVGRYLRLYQHGRVQRRSSQ